MNICADWVWVGPAAPRRGFFDWLFTVTLNLYDLFRKKNAGGITGSIDLTAGTYKLAIVTSAYTVNQNTHDFWDDASGSEVSGTGYTAGGNAVGTRTVTMDGSGNVTFDGDDPATWSQNAAGFTNGRRAVLYKDTGTGSTSAVVAYTADFGADAGNVAGDLTISFNASGIFVAAR